MMADLTAFQRDCLTAIGILEEGRHEPKDGLVVGELQGPHGLAVKAWLEEEAGWGEVHHGRLYPNLDTLVEKGLIAKQERDRRTNEYSITTRGERELHEHAKTMDAATENVAEHG